MAEVVHNGGTSKETLKMFLRISAGFITVLLAVVGVLLAPFFSGDAEPAKGDLASVQPNTELLRMLKEQMTINHRMADAAEKSVVVQEDTRAILQELLVAQRQTTVAQQQTTTNLETAMRRQVTRRDYDELSGDIKEQISKIKK